PGPASGMAALRRCASRGVVHASGGDCGRYQLQRPGADSRITPIRSDVVVGMGTEASGEGGLVAPGGAGAGQRALGEHSRIVLAGASGYVSGARIAAAAMAP